MTEQILTLCDACKSDLEIGGFILKPASESDKAKTKEACENCGKKNGGTAKRYIVSSKRR